MKSILQNEMKDFISKHITIDSHQAKLGNDNDVSVLKLESSDKTVAKDIVQFIESGFKFVLDADFSPSKNKQGYYDIFIEVERNQDLPKNIISLTRDIENVTGMIPWTFSFYKDTKNHKLTHENLNNYIPTSQSEYDFLTNEEIDEDINKFFESSSINKIQRNGKTVTLNKMYSKHSFDVVSMNNKVTEGIFKIDNSSQSESDYINSWLGAGFKVIKLDESFKVSKDNKNIILKAKDF